MAVSPGRNSPLATAKMTPFTMIGGNGAIMSLETHAGSSDAFGPAAIFQATMAPFDTAPFVVLKPAESDGEPDGASSHCTPFSSVQPASPSGTTLMRESED